MFDFQLIIEIFKITFNLFFFMKTQTLKIWLFLSIRRHLGIRTFCSVELKIKKNFESAKLLGSISAIATRYKKSLARFLCRVDAFYSPKRVS